MKLIFIFVANLLLVSSPISFAREANQCSPTNSNFCGCYKNITVQGCIRAGRPASFCKMSNLMALAKGMGIESFCQKGCLTKHDSDPECQKNCVTDTNAYRSQC